MSQHTPNGHVHPSARLGRYYVFQHQPQWVVRDAPTILHFDLY